MITRWLYYLLTAGVAVAFPWHAELWLDGGATMFTNGWVSVAPVHMYHALMYLQWLLIVGLIILCERQHQENIVKRSSARLGLAVGLLIVLVMIPHAMAVDVDLDLSGNIPLYLVGLNTSELPYNDTYTLTIPSNVTNNTFNVSISYDPWLDGPSIVLVNSTNTFFPVNVSVPNNTLPGVYNKVIVLNKDAAIYTHYEFRFTISPSVNKTIFNTTGGTLNVSLSERRHTVFDVELPKTIKDSFTFKSTIGRRVNITCPEWFTCPASIMPEETINSLQYTLTVPANINLQEYSRNITLSTGNKTGFFTVLINVRKAPVIIQQINTTTLAPVNFSNMTSAELQFVINSWIEALQRKQLEIEAQREPIEVEVPVNVTRTEYIPVTAITSDLLQLERLKEELEAAQMQNRQLHEEFQSAVSSLETLESTVSSRPTTDSIRQQVRDELEAERAWSLWTKIFLWFGAIMMIIISIVAYSVSMEGV